MSERGKSRTILVLIAAVAALALAAWLFVTFGNPQWHWRLYAYQAGNTENNRLEPGPSYTGQWNNWEQDGRLVSTYAYANGKRDGAYTTYNEDGAVVSTGQYRNGGLDGVQKIDRGGGFRTEFVYKDGVLEGTETTWYPNGQIAVQVHYVNGVMEGPMTAYAENGMIQSVEPYYNGKLEGVAQTFHPNGKVHSEETYRNGMLNGKRSFYRPDGSLDMTLNYRDDAMNGVQTWYHPDGKTIMKEFSAAYGEPNGEWKEWDEKGELIVDEVYDENGVLKMRDGKEVKPEGGEPDSQPQQSE